MWPSLSLYSYTLLGMQSVNTQLPPRAEYVQAFGSLQGESTEYTYTGGFSLITRYIVYMSAGQVRVEASRSRSRSREVRVPAAALETVVKVGSLAEVVAHAHGTAGRGADV